MQLRSRDTLSSRSRVPSRVSMHSSIALPKARLETVGADHKSLSEFESIETHSMSSNSVQPDDRRAKEPMAGIDLLGNSTIQLLYKYTNNADGHVYLDHKNNYVVRISEGKEPVAPPQYAQVTNHGDHYMDAKGFKFLKTSRSNDMDSWGNLAIGSRALSKPPWATQT